MSRRGYYRRSYLGTRVSSKRCSIKTYDRTYLLILESGFRVTLRERWLFDEKIRAVEINDPLCFTIFCLLATE